MLGTLKWMKRSFYFFSSQLFLICNILTLSNLSLFLTCCATKRDASIVFSISRYVGFSKVGLASPQQFGLMSLIPGLKSSSSPPDSGGIGSAGNGGSPKRDGGRAAKTKHNLVRESFHQSLGIKKSKK